jgi:hypothetical protein
MSRPDFKSFFLTLLLTIVISLTLVTYCCAGEKKICTEEEAIQAESEANRLNDWDSLYRSFKLFSHCDDASISEGYSDSVGRLLAFDWKHAKRLYELTKSDKEFERFVLKHIDELVPVDELKIILENVRTHCPVGMEGLCKLIEDAAR